MPMQVHYSAQTVWSNFSGGWPTIAANGNSGSVSVLPYARLGLLIAVVGTPSGTSPTLQFTINGVDDQGNLYQLLQGASLTAAGNVMLSVGSGFATTANVSASIFVPKLIQVNWVVGGTTPSFPNVQVTLQGR